MLRLLLILAALAAAPLSAAAQTPFQSTRIAVEVRGRGPDVVLIPGLASTPEVWRRTADRLDDTHRVHLISIRGFGPLAPGTNRSGAVSAPVAAEIRRYIASQSLRRPALIGHSMGGQLALRVAADMGVQIDRVMVVDASPFFPGLVRADATVGDIEPIARIAYQAVQFLDDATLRSQGRSLGVELGGAADTLFNSMGWQGGDRLVLAQGLYEVMTLDLRGRLRDIRAPVTVVYGSSSDRNSPRRDLGRLLQASYTNLPTARFEPIAGAEHMVMIDQPARFAAAVARFLR
jgi:pimeloyl-ACP methyl ester carboxylesterase